MATVDLVAIFATDLQLRSQSQHNDVLIVIGIQLVRGAMGELILRPNEKVARGLV